MSGMNQRHKAMRIPLKAKLSASFVAVTICGGLLAGVLVDRNVQRTTRAAFEDRLSYEATMLGQMTANALFGDLDPSDTSLSGPVHALGDAVHTHLSVIAKSGEVVADSATDDPHALPSQADAREVASARAGGAGTGVHDGRLYVAHAIVRDGATLGFARASVPLTEVDAYVSSIRQRIAWGSALSLLAAVVLGLLISSRIVRPIRKLSEGARRVGGGDFEHTIAVSSGDEIGDLATSFNEMTGSLRRTMDVLDGRNHDMRLVLDNVDQGLLTVDREGVVSAERSAAVDRCLGSVPGGARFWEMLAKFDSKAAAVFEMEWEQLIDGLLPLALSIDQLPKNATRGEQHIELSYTPLLDEKGTLSKLLIVITDVTARRAAERAEAEQREVACIFEHMMRDKQGVLDFFLDAETQVLAVTGAVRPPLVEVKRRLHTLKGNSAIYGMQRLSGLCHVIESHMADGGDVSSADREALKDAWARMSERLSAFVGDSKQVVIEDDEYAALLKALFEGKSRSELAVMIRDWRMERAADKLARFAATAQQLARRLDKGTIAVEVSRSSLRLPRDQWAAFWGAFPHLVRNAVDHGFSTEAERSDQGVVTPPALRLSADQRDGEVVIAVSDNGRGIDWNKLAERARRLGMPCARREDLVAALFADGVSTRDEVTHLSGRGVGLAAVKDACERMGGHVRVESEPGRGTTFSLHVPAPRRNHNSFAPPRKSVAPAVGTA